MKIIVRDIDTKEILEEKECTNEKDLILKYRAARINLDLSKYEVKIIK